MAPLLVLVHSPLVGPTTWRPVAERLTAAGHEVRVPSLLHVGSGGPPYWPRAVDAVQESLAGVPDDAPVALVAHSNAGLLVPAIRAGVAQPVAHSLFVDATLPATTGPSPALPPELLEMLRPMAVDGVLPRWTDWWPEEDVAAMLPDPELRRTIVEEQPALPLAYFEQRLPVPLERGDAPCSYLQFSTPYDGEAADARERGWKVGRLPGTHLQQVVDAGETVRWVVRMVGGG
ncbi:alpha/beta hydrolase [Streptomyces xiaopingdaonensis]|uniref:alpha/beta hydrolase n=1 Tax=Streptomyces xiaopingdaonensis TaxID=1565415 RepID=UPI0002F8EDC5|nr:alpha/beta hydrolase [Streptomyces xiaopingdaonensis]